MSKDTYDPVIRLALSTPEGWMALYEAMQSPWKKQAKSIIDEAGAEWDEKQFSLAYIAMRTYAIRKFAALGDLASFEEVDQLQLQLGRELIVRLGLVYRISMMAPEGFGEDGHE